jgi:hypothetical protein
VANNPEEVATQKKILAQPSRGKHKVQGAGNMHHKMDDEPKWRMDDESKWRTGSVWWGPNL